MSIPIKSEVNYLGINLLKGVKEREKSSICDKLWGSPFITGSWDLSIFGHNLSSKAEGVSKLVYPCYSFYIAPLNIEKVNSIFYKKNEY